MNRKLCAPADKAQSWESIDWKKAEAYVKKLQMRICKPRTSVRKQLSETKQAASPKKAAARSKQHEMEV